MRIFHSTLFAPLALGLVITSCTSKVQAQTSSVNTVFAIVGARIEIGNGTIIPKGTVIIRDGLIEAVGADLKVPLEAEIIKGDGLTVYPGFIDTHTTRGVTPPEAQPVQDTAPDISAIAPPFMREANRKGIRPDLRAADYLTLTDDLLRPARLSGFTTEMITPTDGTITGKGVLVNLNGMPRRDSILRPNVAMNFAFRSGAAAANGGGRGYPSSLMGIMAFTRQTLLDAQYYKTLQTAFAQGSSHRPPADEALLALQPVLDGTLPVLYDADNENEIRRAIKMSDEFGLKLMLSGATEAYKVAPLLAQRKIPVLVSLNFGPEPGVIVPTGGAPDGTIGTRPGGGRPGAGGRNRTGTRPPAAGTTDPPALPPVQPPAVTDPNQATPPVPTVPKPDREDNVAPNASPNQANRPAGAAGTSTAADNPDDENSAIPKAVIEERHRKWEEKVNNALKLNQAGIPFAFTTIGVRSQTEFLTNLRRAIKAGLPREVALRALTLDAARLMGVDKQLGTIEAGKTAAIVVMSGDYVLPTTRVRYLFIDKNKFEPDRDQGPLPALPRRPIGAEDDHE